MTNHQFHICWGECSNYADHESYVSDLALSSMWGDDEAADIPPERIEALSSIWNVQHMTMRDLRAASGMTQAEYAEAFCIPRRTVENWDADHSTPPDYVKILIAKSLNLL